MDTAEIAKTSIDRFAEQLGKAEAVLFWQHLDENPSAKQMLAGLYQAGCDPLTLMTLAVLYCKGEELGITETSKRATGVLSAAIGEFFRAPAASGKGHSGAQRSRDAGWSYSLKIDPCPRRRRAFGKNSRFGAPVRATGF
jgi:hypothetical protein